MDLFRRWSKRISVELPVSAFLQNKKTGKRSSNHTAGTLVNVSYAGACVIFTQVLLDGSHLFFTAQEHAENHLYLTDFSIDVEVSDIAATAIWMDGCTFNQQQSFMIGLKFLEKQNELLTTMRDRFH